MGYRPVNCKYVSSIYCTNKNVKRSLFGLGARVCDPINCKFRDPVNKPPIKPPAQKKDEDYKFKHGIENDKKANEIMKKWYEEKEDKITHQLIFKTVEEDFMGEKIKEDKEIDYLLGSDGEIYSCQAGWRILYYIILSKSKSKVIKDKLKSGELYTEPKWR